MRHIIRPIFLLAIFITGYVHAQEELKEIGERMAHYYEQPNPEGFPKWVKDASTVGAFDKPSARFPMMIFMSEVVKGNPDKAAQWCKDFSGLPSFHKATIAWSVRNANVAAQTDCIESFLGLGVDDKKRIYSSQRHDPLARAASNPSDLDMLWALFMATGSEIAVNRIIDVLGRPTPEKGTPGSVEMLLLKGAAKWSLVSNMQQHKRVVEIVRARQAMEAGALRKELDEVAENASKKRSG